MKRISKIVAFILLLVLVVNVIVVPVSAEVSAPQNLTAKAVDGQVQLSWQAVNGATGYNVKKSQTSGASYTTIVSNQSGTSYTDTSVVNGSIYYYVVSAIDGSGESVNSNEVLAQPKASIVEPKVAGGYKFSIALKHNGTLWSWGENTYGQLGKGSIGGYSSTPAQILGLNEIVDIALGYTHSIALKQDGSVWTWGYNYFGQLGIGNTTNRGEPVQVTAISNVKQVSAGAHQCLALKEDGTVWSWGYNIHGSLGDGTYTNSSTPVQVMGLSDIVSIQSGGYSNLALKSDGTVYAWGYNANGELADGTTINRAAPKKIEGLSGVDKIACGINVGAAIKSDGSLWMWGYNAHGELGDGTTEYKKQPVLVLNISDVDEIAGGHYSTIVRKSNGEVWSWGYNANGQLGDGTLVAKTVPVKSMMNKAVSIASGYYHGVVIKEDGTIWTWGENTQGQLGNATITNSSVPVQAVAVIVIDSPETPSNLLATSADNQVSLTWNTAKRAVSYNVKRADGIGGTYTTIATNITANSYNDNSVVNGSEYTYVITAVNGAGESVASNNVIGRPVTSLPAVPTNVSVVAGDRQVQLYWDAVNNADSYSIYRSEVSGGPYTSVATSIVGTNYTDTTVVNGMTYYYTVKAHNASGLSGDSNEMSATPNLQALSAPANLSSVSTTTQIQLSWGSVVEAESYSIYRSEDSGSTYNLLAESISENSYTDISVVNNKRYYYKVTATNILGESNSSNIIYNALKLQTPTNVTATPQDRKVLIQWDTVQNASSYKIKRATVQGGAYSVIASNININEYIDNTAIYNRTYYYVVEAVSNISNSADSQEVSAVPNNVQDTIEVNLKATGFDGKVELNWDALLGATGYNVKRSAVSGSSYTKIASNQLTNSFTDTNIINGKTYYYVVSAITASGETGNSNEAVAFPKAPKVIAQVSGGYEFSMALKYDGTVWSWGDSTYGQLGTGDVGTNIYIKTPKKIASLSEITKISAGYQHGIALKSDGTVWSWGYNCFGQLGNGNAVNQSTPVKVNLLENIIDISAGAYHNIALREDGTVWAWGYNAYGSLGDGSTANKTQPVQVIGLENIIAISTTSGGHHCIALKSDGTIWTWGYNSHGELGDGTMVDKNIPVQVPNFNSVIHVGTSAWNSYAIKNDGLLWCWGSNGIGQLGIGSLTSSRTPIQTMIIDNVEQAFGGANTSLAVQKDGSVWTWGNNNYGQLGDGTNVNKSVPIKSQYITDMFAVSSGYNHSLGVKNDGTVWTWGYNNKGQLGNNTTTDSNKPVQVTGLILMTSPDAPTNLTGTTSDSQVALNWDTPIDAKAYNIKRANYSGGPYTTIATNVTTNTYTDATAINGKLYYYVVTAQNGAGESLASNEFMVLVYSGVAQTPKNLIATVGDSQVALQWDSSDGAISYRIKRSETSGGTYTTIASNIAGTSYTDKSVVNNKNYYYVVSAVNDKGESANSTEVSAKPNIQLLTPPTNVQAISTATYVNLTWSRVDKADTYKVKRKETIGGDYVTIAENLSSLQYIDSQVEHGKTYYYVVTAVKEEIESQDSQQIKVVLKLNPPSNVSAIAGDKMVTLQWQMVTGANAYTIKRAENAQGPFVIIANGISGNEYTDLTVKNDKTYYYILTSYNNVEVSDASQTVEVKPNRPITYTNNIIPTMTSNNTPSGIASSSSNYGSGYEAYKAFDKQSDTYGWATATGKLTGWVSYEFSSPKIISKYTIECRSGITGVNEAPKSWVFEGYDGRNWYMLDGQIGITSWQQGVKKEFEFINSKAYSKYRISVTSVNGSTEKVSIGELEMMEAEFVHNVPTNLTAKSGDSKVELSWDAMPEAISYNIKYSLYSGGPYTTIATGITENNYVDINALNNVKYYYVVSAVTVEGESQDSQEVDATPTHVGENRAILALTMTNGMHKEYDLSVSEIADFLTWYNNAAQGVGVTYFIVNKNELGPYAAKKDYIIFTKILCFEINEYSR